MSHMSKIFNCVFLTPPPDNFKMLHFDANPKNCKSDYIQSYEQFIRTKNNIKQKNLTSFFANIAITISPTSDSFLLIMSQYKNNVYFFHFKSV